MADVVDDGDIVGATVAVVHDNETVLTEGYGMTEPGSDEAVDAGTLFRIGSVTKPVIWTAAMQLIEVGELDPHEDIRTYLDSVSIPGDEPITMAHLATHTPGFEERNQGLWIDDPDERRSLERVLDTEQPSRVRAPGEAVSYSNYGSALAGQVVAAVSQQPLDAYIRERIFEPLGMDTASVTQPAEPAAKSGYTAALGDPSEAPGLALELWPAGSMTASATDMGQFIQAHLVDATDDDRGLSPTVVERMRNRWFTHHSELDGLGFGWFEETHGDVRTLWHNGATPGSFYSHLVLVPDADFGLFVSYDTDAGAGAAGELIETIIEEHVSTPDPPDREPDGPLTRAEELTGTYRGLRVAETTHSKLFTTLQAGAVTVSIDGEYLRTDAGGASTRWVEREPLLFDEVDGYGALAFSPDTAQLYVGHQAFERGSRIDDLAVHRGLAAGSLLGIATGVIGPPLAARIRQFRGDNGDGAEVSANDSDPAETEAVADNTDPVDTAGEEHSQSTDGPGMEAASPPIGQRAHTWLDSPSRARQLALVAAGLVVTFVAGFVAGIILDPTLLSDPPIWYRLLLVLPPAAVLILGVSAFAAALTWHSGSWQRLPLIAYSMLFLATAVACWLLYYWNLFGTPG